MMKKPYQKPEIKEVKRAMESRRSYRGNILAGRKDRRSTFRYGN